jgi:Transcriptional regulators
MAGLSPTEEAFDKNAHGEKYSKRKEKAIKPACWLTFAQTFIDEVLHLQETDTKLVNNILDALEYAKEAFTLMPHLPPHIKPVYCRILNAIYKIGTHTDNLRISDISKMAGLLLPNTTKFINEMVDLNIIKKTASASDKRVVLVQVTDLGEQYYQQYVFRFIRGLEEQFSKLDKINCLIMIDTIHDVYQSMKTVYEAKES